jgi:nucleoside-specific outer membrane channel protein Tsx
MRYLFTLFSLVSILIFGPVLNAGAAPAVSDTLIGYRYSSHYTEPGKSNYVAKNILQVTHVSRYASGQNFINLDVFKSDSNDPAKGGGTGAAEAFVTYRNQFQYGRLFDKPLSFGPVKDMALTVGFDYNTKNNEFASNKRMLVIGPTVKFALPAGFVDASIYYAREWNHCGLTVCSKPGNQTDILFDPYYQFNVTWAVPFSLSSLPVKFQGFYSLNGKKGDDYQNNATAVEQLMRTSLMLDVGQLGWGARNVFWVGPGYEYWRNKFGNHDKPGVDTDALSINVEWHL